MILMNDTAAIEKSIEIAKILCASRDERFPVDADGANQIADFIETLQKRFTEESGRSE